ncbi:MAG: acetyl-CoA carboxylase biotin carboxyl carrier protein subunit [Acidobacteriia bacterium]|nr:acetyl-CoA carboxylase biotin carboxyl carrier protein subunit [Terriglobia bacterium]
MVYEISIDGKPHKLELEREGNRWTCHLDGETIRADAVLPKHDVVSIIIAGTHYEVKRERTATDVHYWVKNSRFAVEVRDPRSLRSRKAAAASGEGPQKLLAPMPGKVVRVILAAGSEVEAGQAVLVVEAMKMQNELKSPKKGTVKQVMVAEGASVTAGEVLAIVE